MTKKILMLAGLLAACATSAPMTPALRSPEAQRRAAVMIEVHCTEVDMFEAMKEFPDPNKLTFEWMPTRYASGVLVSDEAVLTAAHATWCPSIPTVYVTLSNGVRRRMAVVREDLKLDLARLQTYAADPFWHGVAPPILGVFEYMADGAVNCMETGFPRRSRKCGVAVTTTRFAFDLAKGNSGSAIYDQQGHIVGIGVLSYEFSVIGRGPVYKHARIAIPDQGWIK